MTDCCSVPTNLPGCRAAGPCESPFLLPSNKSAKLSGDHALSPVGQRQPIAHLGSARAGARDFPTSAEAAILSAVFLIVGGGAGKFAMRDVRELGEVTRARFHD